MKMSVKSGKTRSQIYSFETCIGKLLFAGKAHQLKWPSTRWSQEYSVRSRRSYFFQPEAIDLESDETVRWILQK